MSELKRSGYRKKGGTHGSLSKAGKSRDLNPRTWDKTGKKSKNGSPFKHRKKHKSPIQTRRRQFRRRVVLRREGNKQNI